MAFGMPSNSSPQKDITSAAASTSSQLSDPMDELYEKYFKPHSGAEMEEKVHCPKCNSENVDRAAGYRGEYRCLDCGYGWQVGGWQAT